MRNLPAVLAAFVLGTALTFPWWSARADQPGQENSAAEDDRESVEIRFARAHVELAKLNLRRAVEANKRTPNVFSKEFMEKLHLHIAIDEAQLAQHLKGEDADAHQVCIRGAEASVKLAEADWKRKQDSHQQAPTAAGALVVERARLVAEIAKLNLERAKELNASESLLKHLQWQIEELRHQVLELQMQLARS